MAKGTQYNPQTPELSLELSVALTKAINANAAIYNKPENAAVVPKALLSVLAYTIAVRYDRKGHNDLVTLCNEELRRLVDDAYAIRADALAALSDLETLLKDIEAQEAVAASDDLDANLTPDLAAEVDRLLSKLTDRAAPSN